MAPRRRKGDPAQGAGAWAVCDEGTEVELERPDEVSPCMEGKAAVAGIRCQTPRRKRQVSRRGHLSPGVWAQAGWRGCLGRGSHNGVSGLSRAEASTWKDGLVQHITALTGRRGHLERKGTGDGGGGHHGLSELNWVKRVSNMGADPEPTVWVRAGRGDWTPGGHPNATCQNLSRVKGWEGGFTGWGAMVAVAQHGILEPKWDKVVY